jgi:hypothetical protein
LELYGETFDEEHEEDKIAVLADLALILNRNKLYHEATSVYRKALDSAVNTFGDSDERTLDIETSLAWNLEHYGEHDEARLLVNNAISKSKACFETEPIR